MKKEIIKVPIFVFKSKKFNKRYGAKTIAITEPCNSKRKECEIHIRSGLTNTKFRTTIRHEIGHIITEHEKIGSKIPHTERIKLQKASSTVLPNRKFIDKKERMREMLAIIYEKIKDKNKSQLKIINKNVPLTKALVENAIRRIKIKQEIIKYNKQ